MPKNARKDIIRKIFLKNEGRPKMGIKVKIKLEKKKLKNVVKKGI